MSRKIILVSVCLVLVGFGLLFFRQNKNSGKVKPPAELLATLPPDPGEAGKETIGGIDSDKDGVRDDIQRYIVFAVPESEKHRAALNELAKEIQSSLLSQTEEESIKIARRSTRVIECLDYIGKRKEYRWKEVFALMLNTSERIKAHEAYDSRISGQVFTLTPKDQRRSTCTFNVEEMLN